MHFFHFNGSQLGTGGVILVILKISGVFCCYSGFNIILVILEALEVFRLFL